MQFLLFDDKNYRLDRDAQVTGPGSPDIILLAMVKLQDHFRP